MADIILIKGGNGEVPQLQDREIAYSKDEKALYIGTANGNVKLCGADDMLNISTQLEEIKSRLAALEGE